MDVDGVGVQTISGAHVGLSEEAVRALHHGQPLLELNPLNSSLSGVRAMACIEHSIAVSAPPDAVFGFVVAEWQGQLRFWPHGIRNWQPATSQPLGVGFRVRYTAEVLGVPFPIQMEVVTFEPGRGWTAKSVSGPPAEGRWEFAQHPAGTLFTYRLTYRMPPPLLGPLLDRWFFAPAWRRAIRTALANLKRLVEASSG